MQNPSNAHLSWEQVFCGDEHGVQGRFQERVGQVMTGVFTDQGMDLSFGDFKASIPPGPTSTVPDIACMEGTTGDLRFIGEMKTPWVAGHDLVAIMTDPDSLRNALGQF
jgi:hypothetical protein